MILFLKEYTTSQPVLVIVDEKGNEKVMVGRRKTMIVDGKNAETSDG